MITMAIMIIIILMIIVDRDSVVGIAGGSAD
jgi:hypothetical protein